MMFRFAHRSLLQSRIAFPTIPNNPASTSPGIITSKTSGDISSVFPSLSGSSPEPLPPRFATVKKCLIHGHEAQVQDSWNRLLDALKKRREEIKTKGFNIVPEINFWNLNDVEKRTEFRDALHQTGVAVIRGVVEGKEALGWKELVKRYIASNPGVKGKLSDPA